MTRAPAVISPFLFRHFTLSSAVRGSKVRSAAPMKSESDIEKLARFTAALARFIERVAQDRYVLAVVLAGSLSEATIWRREALWIWVIEADGVTRRLLSDGEDERIFRIFAEDGINLHAEVIPRSRFKRMVEGASRTAFSCNFFAERKLVYSKDPSIDSWFERANSIATKDKERELAAFSTWTIHAHRQARKRLELKRGTALAFQEILGAAHSVAHTEIIRSGRIWEGEVMDRALELNPALFQIIYLDVLAKRANAKVLAQALDAIEGYLDQNYREHLKPLLAYLKKENRLVPLSEISDQFASSQLYPWHLESACEWLERKGIVEKLSAPFKLTKRSLEQVEEPAYWLQS